MAESARRVKLSKRDRAGIEASERKRRASDAAWKRILAHCRAKMEAD